MLSIIIIDGTDYIEKTERVRFFPGDQYSTEMDIVIVDDDIAEPKEMFYLWFDLPEGLEKRVKLLNNYVPVVIEDDECALFTDNITMSKRCSELCCFCL